MSNTTVIDKLLRRKDAETDRFYSPTLSLQALFPNILSQHNFSKFEHRLFRYDFLYHSYQNTLYSDMVSYASLYKSNFELYEYIRGVYNPVSRLVDFYPQRVYGGDLDFTTMASPSMSLIGTNETLDAAIRKLWLWSKWNVRKNLFVRYGANLGDTYLNIAQSDKYGKVWMELIHPTNIEYLEKDPMGNVELVMITWTALDNDDKPVIKTKVITPESFETYYNRSGVIGQGLSQLSMMERIPSESYENPYGFVPLVHAPHKDIGFGYGQGAAQHIISKIDDLNTLASLVNDQIRNLVQPVIFFSGVAAETDVDDNSINLETERNSVAALYAPQGARAEPIVADVDLRGVLEHIQSQLNEIERDCPELALHTLKGSVYVNDPAVRASYTDVESRLNEARANYNEAVITAHQMAVAIGAYHRYDGFTSFSLNDYANGNLEHRIAPRQLIDDTLALDERLKILLELDDKEYQDAILAELDYTPDQLAEFEKQKQQRRAEKVEEELVKQRGLALANMRSAGLKIDTSGVQFEFNQDTVDAELQQSDLNNTATQRSL